jgi:hypothetical protein
VSNIHNITLLLHIWSSHVTDSEKPVLEPSRLPSPAPAPLGQVQLPQQTLNATSQLAAAVNSVINAALLAFPSGGGGGAQPPLPHSQPNTTPPVAPNVQAGSTAVNVQPHANTAAANAQTPVTASTTISVGENEHEYDIQEDEDEDAKISDGDVF